MVTVRSLGKAWRGRDYDGRELHIAAGGSATMSQRRAERLLADYPGAFELWTEVPVKQQGDGGKAGEVKVETPKAEKPRRRGRRRGSIL
jgi:hypothetical protein